MLLAAPSTCEAVARKDGDAAGQQVVVRAEREAARMRSNCGEGLCSSVRASWSGSVTAASGHNSRRGSLAAGPTSAASRRAASSSKPGRHLSSWPMLGWTMRMFMHRQRVGGHGRRRAAATSKAVAPTISTSGSHLLVIFEPDRAAEQDDQPGQAIGADQRA